MDIIDALYVVDVLFLLFVLFIGYKGWVEGFSAVAARWAAAFVLVFGFFYCYAPLRDIGFKLWSSPPDGVVQMVLFVLLLIIGVIVYFMFSFFFRRCLKPMFCWMSEKFIGLVTGWFFGILIGLGILSVLTLVSIGGISVVVSEHSQVGKFVFENVTPHLPQELPYMPRLDGLDGLPENKKK